MPVEIETPIQAVGLSPALRKLLRVAAANVEAGPPLSVPPGHLRAGDASPDV